MMNLHVVDDGGNFVVGLRDGLFEYLTHDNVPQVADKGSSSLGEGERVALCMTVRWSVATLVLKKHIDISIPIAPAKRLREVEEGEEDRKPRLTQKNHYRKIERSTMKW